MREFVDACRAEGLRAGLYLSPWDRNHPAYGDSPRYNDLYCDQLTELLTRYGPIAEVWFDGANGEGPNGKRQVYDWPRVFGTRAAAAAGRGDVLRRRSRRALDAATSAASPAIRTGRRSIPTSCRIPGASGAGDHRRRCSTAIRTGTVWRPGEKSTSRSGPGWFYHPAEDARVRTVDNLVDLYFTSVGRNSKLLLNVPPTRDGLLHETDVARLAGMRGALDRLFASDVMRGSARTRLSDTPDRFTIVFDREVTLGIADLREEIAAGQSVARYSIEGRRAETDAWQPICRGTTIGHRKLDRFPAATVRQARFVVEETLAGPHDVTVRLYETP